MSVSIKLKQQLKLTLSNQMKMSLTVLQFSSRDILDFLNKEALNDPELKIIFKPIFDKIKKINDDISPLDFISDEKFLIDYLEEQVGYLKLDKKIREIVIFIINNLDHRGYLELSKFEIKKYFKVPLTTINKALEIVHSLEPYGIGAFDLQDCLKIQLKRKDINDPKLIKLIDFYLNDLANKNLGLIAVKLEISYDQLFEYFNIIKKLNPIPARGYNTKKNFNIIPDGSVILKNSDLIFEINDDFINDFNLNTYFSTSKSKFSAATENNARRIYESILKRNSTLNKIMGIILEKQHDFFIYGKKYIKTLKNSDIATSLNLSDSTISRALKNKYINSPQGLIKLNELICYDSNVNEIKEMIGFYIASEDIKKPFSDNALVALLEKNNYKIARRTVTKYREALGIPNSRERKEK